MHVVGIEKWDPENRAGAVAVKSKSKLDVQAIRATSAAVMDWARYQNLGGEVDVVETSTVRGNYDWRSYLHEETSFARRRADRARKSERPAPQPPAPAPKDLYA